MVTYQRERAQDCFTEVKPLLEANWAEVARWKDIHLDPHWERYETAEDLGMLRTYTMREDGALKGYAVFFVGRALHYRWSLQANQDILYVSPDARMFAPRFLRWCDTQLQAEGVQVVSHHVTAARDFSVLLNVLGYEQTETVWSKRLDGGLDG